MSKAIKSVAAFICAFGALAGYVWAEPQAAPKMALIPAGAFEMGDHHGFVDPKHGSDETPLHTVRIDAFQMGVCDVTTQEYGEFLNAALVQRQIEVRGGGVYLAGGSDLLCDTRQSSPSSEIGWDGKRFSVLDRKERHPMVCVRWHGAAAYCNWLSAQKKLPICYDTKTWACDFNKSGYRLPTEAEWEYAARGGQKNPYFKYPWGDDADPLKSNVPESLNPFRVGQRLATPPVGYRQSDGPGGEAWRTGVLPLTTPVGFFNGSLRRKEDFGWPGGQETIQTANGANGFGLYDMCGNVWQWCTEWYERNYYAYSPAENPPGPAQGSPMPDGKTYRCMRGGSWFNGEFGHGRVSNRDPSYYRGPDPVTGLSDADGPWFHIGFRVVLPVSAESRPAIQPTPVQNAGRGEGEQRGQTVQRPRAPLFSALDLNGDGTIDASEMAQAAASLKVLDANGDGAITPDEYQPPRPGEAPRERSPQSPTSPTSSNSAKESISARQTAREDARPPNPDAIRMPLEGETPSSRKQAGSFVLRSSAMADNGELPKTFTGDGDGVTPPLEWSGAPAGTRSYALVMHHTDAQGANVSYWILFNIPADKQGLPQNVKGIGTLGVGSRSNRAAYTPPHSKGPGARTYVFTVYALSAPVPLALPTSGVTQEALLDAMKGKILASADLSTTYTRYTVADGGQGQEPVADRPPPEPREGAGDRNEARSERPQQQDNQNTAQRPERPGGQGGGRIAENNKTPVSPNPGQTVGLFLNTPKASAGYTLFAPKHNTVTYLMDNQGRVVHQWKSEYEPGQSVYLKPNGNLLHCCQMRNRSFTGGGEGGRIEEYNWAGKLIWEFSYSTDQYQQHHDIVPLPNGNILMLVVEKKTHAQCLAAGFPTFMLRDRELYPDSVVEVQPLYPSGGKVVWEWHVWDHLIQDFDQANANYGDVAAHPELIYVGGGRGAPAFWNHANSIAYNAKLDQIVISARGSSEIWFIDHSTTDKQAAGHTGGKQGKGGDLIYRWGNPSAYKCGTERDAQLNQQHDAEWIPDGYPGAGHVTIFNNGYNRGYTSIEEIVPPVDANGHYVIEPGKPCGPEKPVWHYEAKNRTDFFSSEISGAHRLPNGDTLICAGVIGNLFEVTAAGEKVWQYVNPVVRSGILAQGELPGKDVRGHLFNAVFKVHRYAPDYPGLQGRDLTPKGVIELPASKKGKTGMDQADAAPGERPPERVGRDRR